MVTPQEARMQLAQNRQALAESRKQIESIQPRITQTRTQLLQATPTSQAQVRTAEAQRASLKQEALKQITQQEQSFQEQAKVVESQISQYESQVDAQRKREAAMTEYNLRLAQNPEDPQKAEYYAKQIDPNLFSERLIEPQIDIVTVETKPISYPVDLPSYKSIEFDLSKFTKQKSPTTSTRIGLQPTVPDFTIETKPQATVTPYIEQVNIPSPKPSWLGSDFNFESLYIYGKKSFNPLDLEKSIPNPLERFQYEKEKISKQIGQKFGTPATVVLAPSVLVEIPVSLATRPVSSTTGTLKTFFTTSGQESFGKYASEVGQERAAAEILIPFIKFPKVSPKLKESISFEPSKERGLLFEGFGQKLKVEPERFFRVEDRLLKVGEQPPLKNIVSVAIERVKEQERITNAINKVNQKSIFPGDFLKSVKVKEDVYTIKPVPITDLQNLVLKKVKFEESMRTNKIETSSSLRDLKIKRALEQTGLSQGDIVYTKPSKLALVKLKRQQRMSTAIEQGQRQIIFPGDFLKSIKLKEDVYTIRPREISELSKIALKKIKIKSTLEPYFKEAAPILRDIKVTSALEKKGLLRVPEETFKPSQLALAKLKTSTRIERSILRRIGEEKPLDLLKPKLIKEFKKFQPTKLGLARLEQVPVKKLTSIQKASLARIKLTEEARKNQIVEDIKKILNPKPRKIKIESFKIIEPESVTPSGTEQVQVLERPIQVVPEESIIQILTPDEIKVLEKEQERISQPSIGERIPTMEFGMDVWSQTGKIESLKDTGRIPSLGVSEGRIPTGSLQDLDIVKQKSTSTGKNKVSPQLVITTPDLQRSSGTISLLPIQKEKEKIKESTLSKIKLDVKQSQVEIQSIKPKEKQREKFGERTVQKFKDLQIEKFRQVEIQKLSLTQKQPQIIKSKLKQETKQTLKTIIPLPEPSPTTSKRKEIPVKLESSFEVQVRRKGKFVKVSDELLPEARAIKLGVTKTKSGVAQTFRLVPRGTTVSRPDIGFKLPRSLYTTLRRPQPLTYVERRGKTLTARPEVRELLSIKRSKKSRGIKIF